MTTNPSPRLILFERTGRWADSLRRHRLVDRLTLVETRSLSELEDCLAAHQTGLVGVELCGETAERIVEWLGRRRAFDAQQLLVFAERELRPYEPLCREAGAVHFVASELDLLSLAPMFNRYLSDPAFAKLDHDEQPLAERIRAGMPWRP